MQSQDKTLTTGFQSIKGTQEPLTNKLHRRICLSKRLTRASQTSEFVHYLKCYYSLFISARRHLKKIRSLQKSIELSTRLR